MSSAFVALPSQQKECLQKAKFLAMKHIPTTHSSCYTSLGAAHTTRTAKDISIAAMNKVGKPGG